ncbi:MAG: protoporphyrinogen oxidase HemJ [Rhizobiales bacterium]|nr:protoporphyrinogen oxidase HemJ [Hyphomicrobiales bacterium]
MIDLWVKVLHVVAIISWMAGLLYLPRLFVYHAGLATDSDAAQLFVLMEYRLYRYIMIPAMVVAWLTGLWMAWSAFGFRGGWLHAKLLLVVALSAHHGFQGRWRRAFALGQNARPARFYRIQNEVPTLLMIAIVALVILKPF